MARDANGNYTLPGGNPVVTNTLITSTWANTTMADLANEMTDSLSRSGKGGFTAPVGIVDKQGSVPGLNFVLEPTSGLKRENAEDVRIQITTTDVLQVVKTGVKVLSGGSLKPPVVEETGQTVMRGQSAVTVAYFYNTVAPPGWVLEEPDTNLRALVIGPAAGGGTIAGTQDPTNFVANVSVSVVTSVTTVANTSGGTALTVSQMPPHSHTYQAFTSDGTQGGGGSNKAGSPFAAGTTPAGNGQAHTHPIPALSGSGTGSGTNNTLFTTPRYARGVLAKLV